MHAADTNILVRLITRDNAEQLAAAERFISTGTWVPLLALAEMAWVLGRSYGLSRAVQADAVAMMLRHKSLVVQDADLAEAALSRFRANPRVGFSDCLILESAKRAGHLPLGTFDKRLAKEPGVENIAT